MTRLLPHLLAALAVLTLGVGLVWWRTPAETASGHAHPAAAPVTQPTGPRVLYWYDPMRPEVHFDAPGKSPFMDMDLVPKYAATASEGAIEVDPRLAQSLGIRTAPVVRGTFWQRIDTTGRIEVDKRSIVAVNARSDGWIERLYVRNEGEFVARGAPIADVFSPAVDTAWRELALAMARGDPELVAAARARLTALGADAAETSALAHDGAGRHLSTLRAPRSGYTMRLTAREGAAVSSAAPLVEIAGHDPVWVIAAVPEAQSDWIRAGRPAEIRLPALPDRTFEGTVDHIYPELDEATRTQRVRVVLPNPDEALHPGMYAEVTLFGGRRRDVLLVPSDAVIRTGQRDVVIVAEDAGRYRPVHVRRGAERSDEVVILDGLAEGDRVVTSGQFLIDSEASLRGAFRRMAAPAHEHAP